MTCCSSSPQSDAGKAIVVTRPKLTKLGLDGTVGKKLLLGRRGKERHLRWYLGAVRSASSTELVQGAHVEKISLRMPILVLPKASVKGDAVIVWHNKNG